MVVPNSSRADLHSAQAFTACGYVLLPRAVEDPLLSVCYRHAMARAQSGELVGDHQVPDTPAAYGDPIMDMLLERVRPTIEQATGLALFPTYSYFRVYKPGDALAKHTDRPACEVSVSVALGPALQVKWPLWIEGAGGASALELAPGDAAVYRGMDCAHWREPFASGDHAAQVFLHYVDQNGPHAEWKRDKRASHS
jgi:hypothetical protein